MTGNYIRFHDIFRWDKDFLRSVPMSLFICAVGLVMIFEGIPYFCYPDKVKSFADKISAIEDGTLRFIGFGLILVGLAIVYLGKNIA